MPKKKTVHKKNLNDFSIAKPKVLHKRHYEKSIPYQLMDYAKEHREGFTVEIVNGIIIPFKSDKKSRYIISKTNITTKKQVLTEYKDFKNGIVGGWYDKSSDKYYIDKNIAVANESQAHSLAKKYKQKAIWDSFTMKEIPTVKERKIVKRRHKPKKEKLVLRKIERNDKVIQRYLVRGDLYAKGYFYDSKRKAWIHSKRFTHFSARGFYRIDTVPPPQFFSTGLIFKKIWSGKWIAMNQFHQTLNSILRPQLSHRANWWGAYRFYSYEYKRGYLYYRNGKLHTIILESHMREKS